MKLTETLFSIGLLSGITAGAQDYKRSQTELSVQAGAPAGEQAKNYSFVVGVNFRYLFYDPTQVSDFRFSNILPNTLSAKAFFVPQQVKPGAGTTSFVKKNNLLIMPVLIGTKIPSKRKVILVEAGYSYVRDTLVFGAFTYSIAGRINFDAIEAGLSYMVVSGGNKFSIVIGALEFTIRLFQKRRYPVTRQSGLLT